MDETGVVLKAFQCLPSTGGSEGHDQVRPHSRLPSQDFSSAQGCSPGSGDSSGAGLGAQCTARGEAEPGLVSRSVSGRFPLPSPVPEDNGHRLGERARRDSVSQSRGCICPFTAISAGLGQHLAHSTCFKG